MSTAYGSFYAQPTINVQFFSILMFVLFASLVHDTAKHYMDHKSDFSGSEQFGLFCGELAAWCIGCLLALVSLVRPDNFLYFLVWGLLGVVTLTGVALRFVLEYKHNVSA